MVLFWDWRKLVPGKSTCLIWSSPSISQGVSSLCSTRRTIQTSGGCRWEWVDTFRVYHRLNCSYTKFLIASIPGRLSKKIFYCVVLISIAAIICMGPRELVAIGQIVYLSLPIGSACTRYWICEQVTSYSYSNVGAMVCALCFCPDSPYMLTGVVCETKSCLVWVRSQAVCLCTPAGSLEVTAATREHWQWL